MNILSKVFFIFSALHFNCLYIFNRLDTQSNLLIKNFRLLLYWIVFEVELTISFFFFIILVKEKPNCLTFFCLKISHINSILISKVYSQENFLKWSNKFYSCMYIFVKAFQESIFILLSIVPNQSHYSVGGPTLLRMLFDTA